MSAAKTRATCVGALAAVPPKLSEGASLEKLLIQLRDVALEGHIDTVKELADVLVFYVADAVDQRAAGAQQTGNGDGGEVMGTTEQWQGAGRDARSGSCGGVRAAHGAH